MTTQEILAEIGAIGELVFIMRLSGAKVPDTHRWTCSIGVMEDSYGPTFDAALLAAWQAHMARVAA